MEVSVEMKIVARGWHVYSKTLWQSPHRGQKLTVAKEKKQVGNRFRSVRCCLDAEREE